MLVSASLPAGEIIENQSHAGPKTTIKYALWGGANEVSYVRKICEMFVEKHPDVRVEAAVYPWGQYWAKLQTQAASGTAPDVISLYSGNMGVWQARGALLPLTDLVERSGVDLSDYHDAAVETCTWDGNLFSMPIEVPMRSLVFSKDLFQQAGIPRERWPAPDRTMTWDEFRELSMKLTLRKPDGSFAQYGMAANPVWNTCLLRMYGGRVFDRTINPTRAVVDGNEPLIRALVEIFQSQYAQRSVLGTVPLASGFSQSGDMVLLTGQFAMCMTGPWALERLAQGGVNLGIGRMPVGAGPTQLAPVNSVGIYAQSRKVAAAWKFVRFMASEDVQPIFGKTLKGVPALKAAERSIIDNNLGIKGCEAFVRDLEVAVPTPVTSSSAVDGVLSRWMAQTERLMDEAYDHRLRALTREDGHIAPAVYRRFVDDMNHFVEDTVRSRIGLLDREFSEAFARSRRTEPGPLIRSVLPLTMIAFLAALLGLYVQWLRRQKKPEPSGGRRSTRAGYLFILPWLIGFVCFTAGPILASAVLSFTEWDMIGPPRWVGVQHYLDLPADTLFKTGLLRTFSYAALVIPISLFGGLLTAGLLTANVRGTDFFKAVFYFPSLFTGAAVAVRRSNALVLLMGVELMLNACNLVFVAYAKEYGAANGHALAFSDPNAACGNRVRAPAVRQAA